MVKKDVSEIIQKYGIDLEKLNAEQRKLAKLVSLKDELSDISLVGGVDVINTGNKIIASFILIDNNFEIIENKLEIDNAHFPYLSGYYAYRVLPTILKLWRKLENKPDFVFVKAHGISHPRSFGLASHFGVSVNIPTIGVASKILCGELKEEFILFKNKKVAKKVCVKQGTNPIFVSPGHKVSLNKAIKLTDKFFRENHKMPEPVYLAHKYAIRMKKEIR